MRKTFRALIGVVLVGASFGIAAARIMVQNGRIDGVFLGAFILAVVGVLVLPLEGD